MSFDSCETKEKGNGDRTAHVAVLGRSNLLSVCRRSLPVLLVPTMTNKFTLLVAGCRLILMHSEGTPQVTFESPKHEILPVTKSRHALPEEYRYPEIAIVMHMNPGRRTLVEAAMKSWLKGVKVVLASNQSDPTLPVSIFPDHAGTNNVDYVQIGKHYKVLPPGTCEAKLAGHSLACRVQAGLCPHYSMQMIHSDPQ